MLEVGSFDGITAIPVLKGCPGITYWAVDAQHVAIERLLAHAKSAGLESRVQGFIGTESDLEVLARFRDIPELVDVVVFYEVIEHVPDPVASIKKLLARLKPGGRLFLSTPWGSFDNGSPGNMEKRDERGHVRAMTARDMAQVVEAAGGRLEELFNGHVQYHWGDTMHVIAWKAELSRERFAVLDKPYPNGEVPFHYGHRPITFAIAGSLWDWNSKHVHATGIGASEETIVYLAKELAKDDLRKVQVYGQVNEEEVHHRVGYWPREQMRHIPLGSKVVISRAPSYGPQVDSFVGRKFPDKILWLQDAFYPDLNEETANHYEKIVVLTEWHKEQMHRACGVPLEKMEIIGNFLLREHFDLPLEQRPTRRPHHFIYASSPDRGLVTMDGVPGLLDLWPEVLKRWPDATLSIAYGWEGCMKLGWTSPEWTRRFRKVRAQYEALRYQKGVREIGRVNHQQIALEMMSAGVWAYPGIFAETGCLNALKARAAGCVPVCAPYAALAETAACPQTQFVDLPVEVTAGGVRLIGFDAEAYKKRFLEAIEKAVATSDGQREEMARNAIRDHELAAVLPKWERLLK